MRLLLLFGLLAFSEADADPLLNYSYGVLEQARGDREAAYRYYYKAYEKDSMAMPLVRLISRHLAREENSEAALKVYQKLLAARPGEADLLLEYGDFLGGLGRGDAELKKLQEEAYSGALEAMPGGYEPIERLIKLARNQGDDDRARVLLEKLTRHSPEAVNYYVSSTKSLYDSRDQEAAKRIDERYEEAMREHPEWASIARSASDHFRSTGRLSQAIEVLGKHLEASPSSLDLKIRQGILLFTAKRDEEGVRALKEVLEIHPKKPLAHESLAKFYRMHGEPGQARVHAAELLKIRGGSPDEFLKLAAEMMRDGEARTARLLLEKAVFYHEGNAELWMQLAVATSQDPETKDKAARLYREAEELAADSGEMTPAFIVESARELIAQGEGKAAEERLREAIRSFPKEARVETAEAMRVLAELWISEGRNLEAAEALMKRAETLNSKF